MYAACTSSVDNNSDDWQFTKHIFKSLDIPKYEFCICSKLNIRLSRLKTNVMDECSSRNKRELTAGIAPRTVKLLEAAHILWLKPTCIPFILQAY